jgi:ABC-2 type transport system ATP-binding protein
VGEVLQSRRNDFLPSCEAFARGHVGSSIVTGDSCEPVVQATSLRKSYGSNAALDGVDLTVRCGEIVAVLGPNSAGKTTLIEILEGYRRRDAGEVVVLGDDPETASSAWREQIGVVLQTTTLEPELAVSELVRFYAGLYSDPMDADELLELFDLADFRSVRCGDLSGGLTRRVDVALALVGHPSLVFLDEPTTGFDPEARQVMWQVLESLREAGTTMLLTTHYLEEAERIADRIVVIAQGKVVSTGSAVNLGGRHRAVSEVVFGLDPWSVEQLPVLRGELDRSVNGERVTITAVEPLWLVADMAAWSASNGASIVGLEVRPPSLEDIYLRLVRGASGEPPLH